MDRRAIGIDLGTTYSCVGVFRHGKVEIIPNEHGNRTTPSYVAFTDTGFFIGDDAKNQVAKNPKNTVFAVKRLIGRNFDDPILQADMKHWPFRVVNDRGKPKIEIEYKKERKVFTPEEISAMILKQMKKIAEKYLGNAVSDAVITVPSYFTDSQRNSTRDAAHLAGLNVLRLVSEPTAAAIAYDLDRSASGKTTILVFDLGGGTFNVSILILEERILEVRSTSGDTHLGGEDFDNRMVEYFIGKFRDEHGKDLSRDKLALRRLRTACESAKLTLSLSNEVPIEIDSLHDKIDFYSTITREQFEELNEDLFHSTIKVVEKTLHDAKRDKSQVDEIVLVGGSTRIPRLQRLLEDFFNGKQLNKSINPDQAVAYGAATQAAILIHDKSGYVDDALLLDVVPLSLGIESVEGFMQVMIKRNTTIPAIQQKTMSMNVFPKNKSNIIIRVFEGNSEMAKDNQLLGIFEFPIDPTMSIDESMVEVRFDIEVQHTLHIRVTDKVTRREEKMTIEYDKKDLSDIQIESMMDANQIQHDRITARKTLESYCVNIKERINSEEIKHKINVNDKKKLLDVIEGTFDWLVTHQWSEKIQFEEKLKEIQQICAPIMIKLLTDLDAAGKKPEVPHGSTSTSPFYNACRENQIELVGYHLQIMSVEAMNQMEPNGSTALHVASYRGHEKIVELLLEKGASSSTKNKFNNTPLDETKTEKIKEMIHRSMNNSRFVSDSLEWIIPTNDADFQAHQYMEKLKKYGKDPNFHEFIVYIKEYYIDKDLRHVERIDKIEKLFSEAIRTKDPVYLIRAYTAETGFYSTLNVQLAKLRMEDLTNENNLGRAYYIGIIAFHPNFEMFSYTGLVYRGMVITREDLQQYKTGTRILTKTFSSTSKEVHVALRFLKRNHDIGDRLTTICTYQIRNERSALDIEHISLFPNEKEVLILPYSAFKIIDIQIDKEKSPNVEIKLKECEPW